MKLRPDPIGDVRRQVARHLRGLDLAPGSRIVAAVSGGPDSIVMLDALVAAGPARGVQILVAHFHHGIRAEAADRDAAFVRDLAARHDLPFRDGYGDAPGYADLHGLSLEDAARQLRRRFLEIVREETGAAAIALGHTRNDQAETVLLNLLRGAGPRGLGAMPEHGPGFVTRPLIRVDRATVEAYAAALRLPFRTDETNVDVAFTRNRVRHELIPLLEREFNPRIVEALARDARLFREIETFLGRSARAFLNDAAVFDPSRGAIRLEVERLRAEPRAVLRAILRRACRVVAGRLTGWENRHFDALAGLVDRRGAARIDLPGGIVARRAGDLVEIRRASGQEGRASTRKTPDSLAGAAVPLELRAGYEAVWNGGRIRVTLIDVAGVSPALPVPDGTRSAFFDADQLTERGLTVRSFRPGDRIDLFGSGGRKKLSDLFIDRKVPRADRAGRAVIVGGPSPAARILWVVGTARSAHAPVTAETRRIIQLEAFGFRK